MKNSGLFFIFLLAIFPPVYAMEENIQRNDVVKEIQMWPFMFPTELFYFIMILTAKGFEKYNIKEFFQELFLRCKVCRHWRQEIISNENQYWQHFGLSPIHIAALKGDILKIVDLKLDQKVQLYEKDKNGHSMIYYGNLYINFIMQKYPRLAKTNQEITKNENIINKIRKILEKNERKKFNRFLEIIVLEYILHYKFNIFDHSAKIEHLRLFDLLIRIRGNINAYDGYGDCFIDKACKYVAYPYLVEYLLKKKSVRAYIEKNPRNSLNTCMLHNNVSAMKKICELKNVDICKTYPTFPHYFLINILSFTNSIVPVEYYVRTLSLNWEVPNPRDKNKTPLMVIVTTKRYDFALWLLKEKKVNPNVQNTDGNTALHVAANMPQCNAKIINLLLNYRADPSIENIDGKKPIDLTRNGRNRVRLAKTMHIKL